MYQSVWLSFQDFIFLDPDYWTWKVCAIAFLHPSSPIKGKPWPQLPFTRVSTRNPWHWVLGINPTVDKLFLYTIAMGPSLPAFLVAEEGSEPLYFWVLNLLESDTFIPHLQRLPLSKNLFPLGPDPRAMSERNPCCVKAQTPHLPTGSCLGQTSPQP